LSFGIASLFGINKNSHAKAIVPGPLPVHGVAIGNDMNTLGSAVMKDGVIGETISAVEMGIRRDAAVALNLPLLSDALQMLLKDETSHSLLAWNTISWLISCDHQVVRSVRSTLEGEINSYCSERPDLTASDEYSKLVNVAPCDMVDAYGWINDDWRFAVGLYCLKYIIEPTLEALEKRIFNSELPVAVTGEHNKVENHVNSENAIASEFTASSSSQSGIEYVRTRITKFAGIQLHPQASFP